MRHPLGYKRRGFTLAESMLAIFLVALAMGLLGMLFQRSFQILRVVDEKEKARQAARMGFDRLSSELREATRIESYSPTLEFEKIDPQSTAATPFPAPTNPPDNYVPPAWEPTDSYDDSKRLMVKYYVDDDSLYREVRYKRGGAPTRQVVVVGVNSFTCEPVPTNEGEILINLSVIDRNRVQTVSGRVVCPCIKEEFQ